MDIPGYNLVRADHPANDKRGGVCIWFRKSVPLRILDIHFLHECINFQMRIGDKVCNFISLHRPPNQSLEELETFADNLELNLDTVAKSSPFLIVRLGDLNVKLGKWYKNDSTSYEVTKIYSITSQFGMQQLINEPTHILPASSSCIDLIFVSQPNLVMESGVHSSLHQKCHHQIIYAKLNLKINYPPPYKLEIWHYKYANTDLIQRAINYYPWERSLGEKTLMKRSMYLLKQLKIPFRTLFHTKQFSVVTEIHRGSVTKLKS